MEPFRKLLLIIVILLFPIDILAIGIDVSGDGNGQAGGSNSGATYLKTGVSIGFAVGFKATRYEYNDSGTIVTTEGTPLYYVRKRYLHVTNMPIYKLLVEKGISTFEPSENNIENVCGGNYYGSYSHEVKNYIEFSEEAATKCTVNERSSDGFWQNYVNIQTSSRGCVFLTKPLCSITNSTCPGEADMGITFQATPLVQNYLNEAALSNNSSLFYQIINRLYGKPYSSLSNDDVRNEYVLIEPLYYYIYKDKSGNETELISTIKDIYIYAIRSDSEVANNGISESNWFNDAMKSIYSSGDTSKGGKITSSSTVNNVKTAACWRSGMGAIYISMRDAIKPSCASDQCCFDKVSDNQYKYNVEHSTDDGSSQHYNKYKLKNPNNSTFVNDKNQILETYTNGNPFPEPDSTFKKCGCDQTDPDMCCYKYNESTGKYEYDHTADSKLYDHYQFIDAATGKPAPNDTRPGEFKSCGCDPETQCCYDSTGTYQASYQGTGYGVSGRYSKDGGVLMPCFCASSSSSNGSCGGKATKKQVNADNDELACLANFDSSGTSRSDVPGAYYNNEVGCEFEYEVSYPEPSPRPTAESGKKLQLVTGPLVTVKVTRKCVSTNKSKLEALTAKPTIVLSSKKFKYDDQSMLGLTSAQTFDLYTRDDKTESGKSFKYQSENVGTTINEGDYFLREYTYTYNYYIPYLEYNSTEGVVKILSTEPPEENNEFWINKLPIPYNAESKTGKDYTRYISMNITQNGSNKLSYSDGGITCNYNVTDANKVKFFYRVIDLDNMNKLSRNLGYNWSDSRGQTVKTAVEQTGNYTALTSKDKFSFTLDPATMVMIRNYNKKESQGNHGGYNDGNRLTETKEGVNGCHYHWYSPFLYCLYYGNDGTNCNISTSVDVSGCLVKFKSNDNLENTFDHYTSISKPNSGGFDQYDFETNMGNLIKKQYNLG